MDMAKRAAALISAHVFYPDGESIRVVIADTAIAGAAESAMCVEKFKQNNVVATLTVTPCWCYGLETMDLDPHTVKAVLGLNGTERPGAVYLAAVVAAYAQRGLPAFSIYSHDVRDKDDRVIPTDVTDRILRFAPARGQGGPGVPQPAQQRAGLIDGTAGRTRTGPCTSANLSDLAGAPRRPPPRLRGPAVPRDSRRARADPGTGRVEGEPDHGRPGGVAGGAKRGLRPGNAGGGGARSLDSNGTHENLSQ